MTLTFQPAADRFYAEGYWRDGDLWEEFAAVASRQPDKSALILGDRRMSFDELRRAAHGVSSRLAEAGVTPGDVVVLIGRHSIEACVAMLGCLHRGVVLAPLPPMFAVSQISAVLSQTTATALITFGGEKELAKCLEVAGEVPFLLNLDPAGVDFAHAGLDDADRVARGADDLAMVLHSSGTTSEPKGVAHSSNTLRYATEGVCRRWQLSRDDVCLVVCEFGFVGGLTFGYLPVLLMGATGVLMSRWNAEDALRLIEEHRCTYVLAMPTHSADLIDAAFRIRPDLSSMRVLAAPGLTSERRKEMKQAFGVAPLADYGLSEVPGHAAHTLIEPEAKMIRTEGRPYEGTEIRIVDDEGNPVPANTFGNVVVNGPSRFLGFYKNEAATKASITDWGGYRTGDLGYLDEDGHLVFLGRIKDIIRRGGVTIAPSELEPVISRHPAVAEVAVVPLPDERLGERACAAVIPAAGESAPTLEELQGFLDGQGVAKYTWPESVESFEDFPRTASLKVVKRKVVDEILSRSRAASA